MIKTSVDQTGHYWSVMNQTSPSLVAHDNEAMNVTSSDDLIFEQNWEVLFMLPLVIFGVAGNILVSMAVTMEKRLQSVTNYFLLSLAITDLLVCMVVWPFSMLNEFFGYWPLNVALCNLYITFDVLLCTSSILHLCTISLERFIAIRSPLASRTRSKTAVRIKILLVYLTALAISSPIMILGIVDQKNILQDNHCVLMNNHFIIYGSVSAFYIPLVIMGIFFGLTVQQLRAKWKLCDPNHQRKDGELIMRRFRSNRKSKSFKKCLKSLEKEQGHRQSRSQPVEYIDPTPASSDNAMEQIEQIDQIKPLFCKDSCDNSECSSFKGESPDSRISSLTFADCCSMQGSSNDYRIQFNDLRDQSIPENDTFDISGVPRSISHSNPLKLQQTEDLSVEKLNDMNDNETIRTGVTKTFSAPSRLHDLMKKHAHGSTRSSTSLMSKKDSMKQKHDKNCVRTEQKASKTLGIIFASFVVCWAPFFIVNVLTAVCDSCKFDHLMITTFVWLGYVSSTLNPIIYTVFNRTFRTTIIKLMKCQYKNVQKSMRIKAICIGVNYQVQERKNTNIQIPL